MAHCLLRSCALAFVLVLVAAPTRARAQSTPEITAPVTDLANVLAPDAVERITARLVANRNANGAQIAVLTVPATGDETIEQFSLETARAWRGGSADRNDGVLFTLAVNDHKMRIEVGTGLVNTLTDARATSILDGLRPLLRAGAYEAAIDRALDGIIAATAPGAAPAATPASLTPIPPRVTSHSTTDGPWTTEDKIVGACMLAFFAAVIALLGALIAWVVRVARRGRALLVREGRIHPAPARSWWDSSGESSGVEFDSGSSDSGSSDSGSSDSGSSGDSGGSFGGDGGSSSW